MLQTGIKMLDDKRILPGDVGDQHKRASLILWIVLYGLSCHLAMMLKNGWKEKACFEVRKDSAARSISGVDTVTTLLSTQS